MTPDPIVRALAQVEQEAHNADRTVRAGECESFAYCSTAERDVWQAATERYLRALDATKGALIVACPCCGGPVRHTCEDCGEAFYGHGSSMRLSTRRFAPALREARELLREARAHIHTLDAAWVGPWCERVAVALGETADAE